MRRMTVAEGVAFVSAVGEEDEISEEEGDSLEAPGVVGEEEAGP